MIELRVRIEAILRRVALDRRPPLSLPPARDDATELLAQKIAQQQSRFGEPTHLFSVQRKRDGVALAIFQFEHRAASSIT